MRLGIDASTLSREHLGEAMLLATLAAHYAQIERRLETAVSRRSPEICRSIATAALDLFLDTCDPAVRTALEARRPAIVEALVARRAAVEDAVSGVARTLVRPLFTGPVGAIYMPQRRINTVVLGASERTLAYATVTRDQFLPDAQVVDASTLSWADLADRNAVVYGAADTALVAELLAHAKWEVTPTHVTIGDRKIGGEQLVLIACRARPSDPTLADIVYTSADELNLLGVNNLHHGPNDFVIGRRNKSGRYQIVMRANFARGPEGEMLTHLEGSGV